MKYVNHRWWNLKNGKLYFISLIIIIKIMFIYSSILVWATIFKIVWEAHGVANDKQKYNYYSLYLKKKTLKM